MEAINLYIDNSNRLSPGEVLALLSELEEIHNNQYNAIMQGEDSASKEMLLALWRQQSKEIQDAKLSLIPH